MINVRPSDERGHANHGWLDSHHSFSFADYYDPSHMGFRALRVINEDRAAAKGFGTHPHKDMEIISYVIDGALERKDSMGTGSVIEPGDVQRMTAGSGVLHSEYNASKATPVHFLQIWIVPSKQRLQPSYEQKRFGPSDKQGKLRLVAAEDGRDGAVTVHQDVALYASLLAKGDRVTHALANGRHAWVQLIRGEIALNGTKLRAGDGAAISDEKELTIEASSDAELLLFDLS